MHVAGTAFDRRIELAAILPALGYGALGPAQRDGVARVVPSGVCTSTSRPGTSSTPSTRRGGSPELRAGLLHDFEHTTLTPANFCALKGIAPPLLDALLATARQEAREPALQRARRADEDKDSSPT